VLNNGGGEKRIRKSNRRGWIHQESPLNNDLGINNERQDCKISNVVGYLWRGRVNRGDEGEEYG
jgi:hypothetical protein